MKSLTLAAPLIAALVLASPMLTLAAAPEPQASAASVLGGPKGEAGYAIGLNIGTQMRAAGLPDDVDIQALMRGMTDGLGGRPPLLNPAQARAAMVKLQAGLSERRAAVAAKAAAVNAVKGAAFLKANAAKPGVVTRPSGLQYEVLKVGSGPRPKASDTVVVNYRGALIDGTEFDSSYRRGQPAEFPVGGVIKGWTEALQLMPVGSKWRIVLPADLAYGDKGAGQQIGPGAVLVFEVELISIKPA